MSTMGEYSAAPSTANEKKIRNASCDVENVVKNAANDMAMYTAARIRYTRIFSTRLSIQLNVMISAVPSTSLTMTSNTM